MIKRMQLCVKLTLLLTVCITACSPASSPHVDIEATVESQVQATVQAISAMQTESVYSSYVNTPEGVVYKFVDAVEKNDVDQYIDTLDPELDANEFFADTFGKDIQAYRDIGEEVAFQDLSFETQYLDSQNAKVYLNGKIRNLARATEYDLNSTFFARLIDGSWYVSDQSLIQVTSRDEPAISDAFVSVSKVKIVPIRFSPLNEIYSGARADGWEEGSFELAMIVTDHPQRHITVKVSNVFLETAEGITYPAEFIVTKSGTYGVVRDMFEVSSVVPIPPGLIIGSITYFETVWREEYKPYIDFKFASASNPKRVVFDQGDDTQYIDVPLDNREWYNYPIDAYVDVPDSRSSQDLLDALNQINPNLKIEFSDCSLAITNTNLYQNEQLRLYDVYSHYALYFPEKLEYSHRILSTTSYDPWIDKLSGIELGPGQSNKYAIGAQRANERLMYIVFYQENSDQLDVFQLPPHCWEDTQ